jgi:cobalt-precorrin 5A hydrolase
MEIRIIAFTLKGAAMGENLATVLRERSHTVTLTLGFGPEKVDRNLWTEEAFHEADALVFIGAAGIAVRSVAPYVSSKCSDPGVIVVDDCGRFSIPILSGHLGGANALAEEIAGLLHAVPVITTATDGNGVFAVDTWAKKQGLTIVNSEKIKRISARLLAGEIIRIHSQFPITGSLPKGVELTDGTEYDVLISHGIGGGEDVLRLVPRVCTLGIGCRRGSSEEAVEDAFHALLLKENIAPQAIRLACSIDLKAGEKGILEFCSKHKLPFETFSPRQLNQVEGIFTPSDFVKQTTGTDNVCERSAVCGCHDGGELIVKKSSGNGITMALAMSDVTLSF